MTGLVVTNSASTELSVTRGEPPVRMTSSGGTLAGTEKITVKLQLYYEKSKLRVEPFLYAHEPPG